jgi:glycosyltransferase involved in cell wall biosynthesis
MKVSLVISTYNWKEALYLSLLSVKQQTQYPYEVIIADDGSRNNTSLMIEEVRKDFPCTLKHIWQEDDGFRKSAIMNKAFAHCEGDYIIQIDGDIIMNSHFIEDHISEAREGYYVHGSRGKIDKQLTQALLRKKIYNIHLYTKGLKRKFNTLRIPFLSPLFYKYKENSKERGCNLAFWKQDLYATNGYDERMIGYGYEDIDLPARLRRLGVKKRFIKFKAIEYHLDHDSTETKHDMSHNKAIFDENNMKKIIHIESGIDQCTKQINIDIINNL